MQQEYLKKLHKWVDKPYKMMYATDNPKNATQVRDG
jgi:hypothetical protein